MSPNHTLPKSKSTSSLFSFHLRCTFSLTLILIISLYTPNIYSDQVTFGWEPNTGYGLAGYRIYHGKSSGEYDTVVDVGNQTSYTLSDFVSDETYFFALTAYDFSGNESSFSNEMVYYYTPMSDGDLDGKGQDDVIIDFGPDHGIRNLMNNRTWNSLTLD